MTYKQLQKITLEKLYATQGAYDMTDDVTKDYLRALPAAANEALVLLAQGSQGHTKRLEFTASRGAAVDLQAIARDYLCAQTALMRVDGAELSGTWQIAGSTAIVAEDGQFALYYKALPELILQDTAPDTEIDISSAAASLLPLYIASQLYKDDDPAAAAAYRSEFEAGREALEQGSTHYQGGFVQTAGWCV